uniref:Gamma-secretase subunit aph-1 n=1 Tax=Parascaris univalens TaxID=6257 RepID=A0A915AD52_PARUN
MTAFAGIAYLLIAFSPALAIFHKVIASDPLRIILFVLGAFFWLLSLLFSALIWYAAVPLRNTLVFAVCVSIALQELARLLHFILLKKAQKGLSKMAANGMHISGVHTLHHARHMLAVVCGLGMGVMAALFLIINVIADFWGEGTVGLPATVPEVADRFDVKLFAKDEKFPLTYSLSACILTLCHMCWTILFWDGCHKKRYTNTWWTSIAFVVASHYVVSALSFWNRSGITMQTIVLCAQLGILLMNAIYSCCVVGITWTMARQMPLAAAKHLYTVITCKEGCHRNVRSTDSNSDARRISSMNEEPHTVNT